MIADALITEDRLPRFQIIYTSENLAGLNQRSMVFIRADEFERLKAAAIAACWGISFTLRALSNQYFFDFLH